MANNRLLAVYLSSSIRLVRSLALLNLLFIRANVQQACFEEKTETGFFYRQT